ncbi:MAG: hypothetical protein HOQ24_09010 [Mycobacteriaceae bacterium]|nr:hypothetical protein [Mycobacteriaceae bacterium]
MRWWFEHRVVDQGRLPLLCFLLGFIVVLVLIRVSVRMIRARVRWWPGNFRPGGQHVHHMVFGVVLVLVSGIAMITAFETATRVEAAGMSALFGAGAALVLDEFALIFYLRDVYWSEQGRTSVDAVFVAIAVAGLLLLGLHPFLLLDLGNVRTDEGGSRAVLFAFTAVTFALAAIVIAKGKIWTGLFGMFFFPLLIVGAIRLGRPGAPWARWRYADRPRLMQRAVVRERRFRRPIIRIKIYVQDSIAGKPSVEHVLEAAEVELSRRVRPAPAPDHDWTDV